MRPGEAIPSHLHASLPAVSHAERAQQIDNVIQLARVQGASQGALHALLMAGNDNGALALNAAVHYCNVPVVSTLLKHMGRLPGDGQGLLKLTDRKCSLYQLSVVSYIYIYIRIMMTVLMLSDAGFAARSSSSFGVVQQSCSLVCY